MSGSRRRGSGPSRPRSRATGAPRAASRPRSPSRRASSREARAPEPSRISAAAAADGWQWDGARHGLAASGTVADVAGGALSGAPLAHALRPPRPGGAALRRSHAAGPLTRVALAAALLAALAAGGRAAP